MTKHYPFVEERAIRIGYYILESDLTVRELAHIFEVSKSTVHKDLTDRLKVVDKSLYEKVREKLDNHKATRHIKGGAATKRRWSTDTVAGNGWNLKRI